MSKPVTLIILDGWGVAPVSIGNAITKAEIPNFKNYLKNYPAITLQASGEAVGLPFGEMGNSEVGHLNLGAGRIVYQTLPRITQSIWGGDFFVNPAFIGACDHVKKNQSTLHLMGLVSNGGVHSYIEHLSALIELVIKQEIKNFCVHVFLDGRDTAYNNGINFVEQLDKGLKGLGVGCIATIAGRFYAMDRDNRWDRVEKAYQAMVLGHADKLANDAVQAVRDSYSQGVYDEEFLPTVIVDDNGQPLSKIKSGDAAVFFNFRGDRARELTKSFTSQEFDGFKRPRLEDLYFATMTEYEKGLAVKVAFPPEGIKNSLPEILSQCGKRQLHIAETEKYAHVTFFFDCGQEDPFIGQDNILVQSPKVRSYADQPEMSALEVTQKLVQAIGSGDYDFIVVNFANADMVGHTGILTAGIKAVEYIDECLGQVVSAILAQGGIALVTADHGNAEEMINLQNGEMDKEHSSNPVPLIIIGKNFELKAPRKESLALENLTPSGVLADIAPTILKIMGLEKSENMNGHSLL